MLLFLCSRMSGKAKAVKNNMATSPGVPITFSINVTHAMPCCPPGLKMLSCIKGVSISVNVTEVHTIVKKSHEEPFPQIGCVEAEHFAAYEQKEQRNEEWGIRNSL